MGGHSSRHGGETRTTGNRRIGHVLAGQDRGSLPVVAVSYNTNFDFISAGSSVQVRPSAPLIEGGTSLVSESGETLEHQVLSDVRLRPRAAIPRLDSDGDRE